MDRLLAHTQFPLLNKTFPEKYSQGLGSLGNVKCPTTQSILKANRDYLNTEQAKYTKDQKPDSPHWQQLWKIADSRRAMSKAQSTLKEQKAPIQI